MTLRTRVVAPLHFATSPKRPQMRSNRTSADAPSSEAASAEMLALDALLDAALADSFPASDPPALCSPHGQRPKHGVQAKTSGAQGSGAPSE
ncbi:MAG: hypothetical protein AVDCRST_MAG93-3748 [uncultured Chloroflexia bacterium]|uniref:Uncharacterized protein n=1 Tax=uncultured Chloroflexia bacterium TaxID=1672391 RepID=A0A6J4JVW0_9CHLR|nr:MAG: hypothetical protein AVDCRST_MAG93-3748 [uncultured Chloroflexia bacterium]